MAHIGSIGRLGTSLRTSLRLGNPLSGITKVQLNDCLKEISDHKLEGSFRKLCLSPLEAQLSANVQSQYSKHVFSPLHIDEYRLPSVYKPINITVPTLYNGAVLEKELPPISSYIELIDPIIKKEIQEAPSDQATEKQAARLIMIRRKKMKKHKLKKLRKKFKFEWQKTIQKREYTKEKAFQAEQMAIVREAEAFDAKKYVEDILARAKQKPLSSNYRGRSLPKWVVTELKERDRSRRKMKEEHKLIISEMKEELREKGIMKE